MTGGPVLRGGVDTLKREYPGDDAWARFVAVFGADKPDAGTDHDLAAAIGDEAIATVLLEKLGTRAAEWLAHGLPALEGRSPAEILEHPEGADVIRTFLMRMPT